MLVDYAHTPDSLENVLRAARSLTERPADLRCSAAAATATAASARRWGAISAALADLTIVTSDNPRSEDPAAIVAEILAGIDGGRRGRGDRRPPRGDRARARARRAPATSS